MEDDHGPHFRLQPDEAALDLVSVGDRRLERVGARHREGGDIGIDVMPPGASRLIDAGV